MPSHGYYWIHPECFERMEAIASDIKTVKKYLEGELPRINIKGDKIGCDTVEQFLIDMYDFDRRARNVFKLIKAQREGTPITGDMFEPPRDEPSKGTE